MSEIKFICLVGGFGFWFVAIAAIIVSLAVQGVNFSTRCERAGGQTVSLEIYKICVKKDALIEVK